MNEKYKQVSALLEVMVKNAPDMRLMQITIRPGSPIDQVRKWIQQQVAKGKTLEWAREMAKKLTGK